MNREYHRWHSPRLGRDMELLVFGYAGAKVLVFPTRDGRFYEYENLRMVDALRHKIDAGQLQLYCVDSVAQETFYCGGCHPGDRLRRHILYEEYILNEVMPLMAEKNDHPCTIAHGVSLGAFLAANIAFRHPHLFRKLSGFSGRYDPTLSVECFDDLLAGYRDEHLYFHTPIQFLPGINGGQLDDLRRMDIVLVIGRADPFLHNNRYLSHILWSKNVPHALHEWDGRAHSGYYWRRMAPLYL
jgi:esterase/lipase superfamily enzyme